VGALAVRSRVGVAAVIVVLLTAFVGLSIATSRTSPGQGSSPPLDGSQLPGDLVSLPAFKRHFSVLSRRATAKDALPRADRSAQQALARQGADPHESRRVSRLGNWTAYAIPGKAVICLFAANQRGGGSACPYLHQALDGLLFTVGSGGFDGIPKTSVLLVGLMPNEVRMVKVTFAGGSTRMLHVHNNAFMALLSTRARRVSYRDTNGAQVRGVPSCGAC
jgi:hypothetical protein